MQQASPQLVFFSELTPAALVDLWREPGVLDLLVERGYGVAMALTHYDPEAASAARLMAGRGIPLTAWLLLSEEAGYWFNVENYPQAVAHYRAFREWVAEEDLTFAAVGVSMSLSRTALREIREANALPIVRGALAAERNALYPAAAEAYYGLAAEIRADGFALHSYQYPFIVDDRRATTTIVQRTLSIVDLPADVEVLLCYSSLFPPHIFGHDLGGALVVEYGIYADSIGVGSTGGSRVMDPLTGEEPKRLAWEGLARDLRLAAQYTDIIHVSSLEGCVARGHLERLRDFDWSAAAVVPRRFRAVMQGVRLALAAILWWSRHGLTLMGWLGWVVVAVIMLRRAAERLRR